MDLAYNDIILDEGLSLKFTWFLFLSILLHLCLLVLALFVLPDLTSRRKPLTPIYTVNLVTLPAGGSGQAGIKPSAPAPAPKPVPAPETKPAPAPKPEPAPAPKAEPIPKKADLVPLGPVEPKETPKPEVKKMEKPPPAAEIAPKIDPGQALDQALARIKSKVDRREKADDRIDSAIDRLAQGRGGGGNGTGTQAGVRGTGPVSEMDSRMRDYYLIIYNRVSANWVMPPENLLASRRNLEAVYVIKINREGQIAEGWFERKSGQKLFDQSVEKAVLKSNPLPPLPDVFKGQNIEIGLRFTPSGLQER